MLDNRSNVVSQLLFVLFPSPTHALISSLLSRLSHNAHENKDTGSILRVPCIFVLLFCLSVFCLVLFPFSEFLLLFTCILSYPLPLCCRHLPLIPFTCLTNLSPLPVLFLYLYHIHLLSSHLPLQVSHLVDHSYLSVFCICHSFSHSSHLFLFLLFLHLPFESYLFPFPVLSFFFLFINMTYLFLSALSFPSFIICLSILRNISLAYIGLSFPVSFLYSSTYATFSIYSSFPFISFPSLPSPSFVSSFFFLPSSSLRAFLPSFFPLA